MSYQAITDIIVNPLQTQELQLSNSIKDSPKSTSSTSFADLVSFYKNDSSTDTVNNQYKNEEPQKVNETADSKESVSEEKVNKSSENKDEKKTDEVSDKKVKDSSEDKKSEKVENEKNSVKDEKKVEFKSQEAEADGDSKKKLNSKDFARLNQIAEEALEEETEKSGQLAVNLQQKNLPVQNEVKEDKEVAEELITVSPELEITENVIQFADVENEASEFNFENKDSDSKKQLALDKDGKITVEDLRTNLQTENADDKKSALKVTDVKMTDENTAVITMDLNNNANADVLSLNNQTAGANGSNFQTMLNNQIQNSAPEFVKAGNLVLKDNNQGTINLVLHPDDLGNVKIHLSLDGKTISGQITVATKEALQVFKDNAETLREAFIKSGFDAANFDVAYNNSSSFGQNDGFTQNDGSDIFARNVYGNKASGVSAEMNDILQNVEDFTNYSVNIVA